LKSRQFRITLPLIERPWPGKEYFPARSLCQFVEDAAIRTGEKPRLERRRLKLDKNAHEKEQNERKPKQADLQPPF
jgi:hypothetical protein